MSPDPYVRGQALALAAALVVAAVLGWAIAALACTVVLVLASRLLYGRFQGDLKAAGITEIPARRKSLDAMVVGNIRLAAAAGILSGAIMLLAFKRPDIGVPPVSATILALTGLVVLLSSLVDWFIVLPRMSGLLGIRPCRDPDSDFPRRPETWREVTRWWYIHRIIAAVVLRFGLSLTITFALAHHIAVPHGAALVAGALVGGFASYMAAAWDAFWEAGHLTLVVGRTVERRQVSRVPRSITVRKWTLRLPFFALAVPGPCQPREYVYDVALEGVQLARAETREQTALPRHRDGRLLYERDTTKLPLKDVRASQPRPAEPFAGCRGRCSGINWYCIENPRCFKNK